MSNRVSVSETRGRGDRDRSRGNSRYGKSNPDIVIGRETRSRSRTGSPSHERKSSSSLKEWEPFSMNANPKRNASDMIPTEKMIQKWLKTMPGRDYRQHTRGQTRGRHLYSNSTPTDHQKPSVGKIHL